MGILEVLFIVFLILKLTGFIAWSWWWVFAPLYPAAFIWLTILICLFIAAMSGTLEYKRARNKRK